MDHHAQRPLALQAEGAPTAPTGKGASASQLYWLRSGVQGENRRQSLKARQMSVVLLATLAGHHQTAFQVSHQQAVPEAGTILMGVVLALHALRGFQLGMARLVLGIGAAGGAVSALPGLLEVSSAGCQHTISHGVVAFRLSVLGHLSVVRSPLSLALGQGSQPVHKFTAKSGCATAADGSRFSLARAIGIVGRTGIIGTVYFVTCSQ
jgi:hypothetical protein